ncbi:MAG: hypothetical protein JWO11_4009 [Nocardioides sp.]|nr:hypothetical protein [Nocardioides sp.]
MGFAFALTHRAEYRVFLLHDPQRLVIDFRHRTPVVVAALRTCRDFETIASGADPTGG